jgi:hypothetical protein
MTGEPLHHNGLIIDDDVDAISTADFYFDDPSLQFPLSPISVRKEIFSLTPFWGESPSMSTIKGVWFSATNVKQNFRTNMDLPHALIKQRTALCPNLSPRSEGTETTTDWMKDSCDTESYCGSLTYSVETDRFADDYDDENIATMMIDSALDDVVEPTQRENSHKCFRILDGVISAIQIIFRNPNQQLCYNSKQVHRDYGTGNNPRATSSQHEDLQVLH